MHTEVAVRITEGFRLKVFIPPKGGDSQMYMSQNEFLISSNLL